MLYVRTKKRNNDAGTEKKAWTYKALNPHP